MRHEDPVTATVLHSPSAGPSKPPPPPTVLPLHPHPTQNQAALLHRKCSLRESSALCLHRRPTETDAAVTPRPQPPSSLPRQLCLLPPKLLSPCVLTLTAYGIKRRLPGMAGRPSEGRQCHRPLLPLPRIHVPEPGFCNHCSFSYAGPVWVSSPPCTTCEGHAFLRGLPLIPLIQKHFPNLLGWDYTLLPPKLP